MNQDWQTFLGTQGAQIENGVVQGFTATQIADSATRLYDLSQFGLLRVSGDDAQSFLQNLFSNDINEVSTTRAQLSSFNNAKGRMLASLLVWRDATGYLLQLPRDICEPMRKKLSMYVLRAKVKVEDLSDSLVSFGLAGASAHSLLQAFYPTLTTQPMSCVQAGEDTVLCRDAQRFQITTTPQRARELWTKLQGSATMVGSVHWDGQDIRAGIPFVYAATQEAFVPQMLNFEVIGGVNFKKGCYPGQEVVARMHYLGKPKRRMFLAHLATDALPLPGTELFSTETAEQACGAIVSAAPGTQGGVDVLAVVQIASQESHTVHLGAVDGPVLQFLPLPYALP